jgi:Fur family zinc uptake transcriptional regulator
MTYHRQAAATGRSALTRNQAHVLEKLERSGAPLSAYALLDQLREHGFRAPLQVYRALDALVRQGLAHRLESLNAFVACSAAEEHGHAHASGITAFAICDRCGHVVELSDQAVEERLREWVGASGFVPDRAVIEFRGRCAGCAAASPP